MGQYTYIVHAHWVYSLELLNAIIEYGQDDLRRHSKAGGELETEMNEGYIGKAEAIERIGKRSCKGRGKNYTAGYMDGLETAKRVLSAMESKAELVRHTELTRGDGETRVILMHQGIYAVYGDERLLGRCERCKHVNLLDSRYCSFCGAKVDSWREKGDD